MNRKLFCGFRLGVDSIIYTSYYLSESREIMQLPDGIIKFNDSVFPTYESDLSKYYTPTEDSVLAVGVAMRGATFFMNSNNIRVLCVSDGFQTVYDFYTGKLIDDNDTDDKPLQVETQRIGVPKIWVTNFDAPYEISYLYRIAESNQFLYQAGKELKFIDCPDGVCEFSGNIGAGDYIKMAKEEGTMGIVSTTAGIRSYTIHESKMILL